MLQTYRRYLSINLKNYKNIGIDLEIGKVLLAFTIGIIIAAVIISLQRNAMIAITKKLMRYEAFDESSSRTIYELGFNRVYIFICKNLLIGSGRLKRNVKVVGEVEYTYDEYVSRSKKKYRKENNTKKIKLGKITDFKTAKLYLRDKDSQDTRTLYDQKTSPTLHIILFCLLVFSLYVCITLLLPGILTLINNAMAK